MGRSRKKQPKERHHAEKREEEKEEKTDVKKTDVKKTEKKEAGESRKKESERVLSDRELRRYILFLILPLTVLLLIIAAMIFGRRKNSENADAENTENVSTQIITAENIPVIEPDTKEYFHDFGGSILSQDTVPEINEMMEAYFRSISECDMETFLHLFTSENTSEEENFRTQFEQQKQYIDGYQNISCYTAKGIAGEDYAVYVYYEIKFKDVNTAAPDLVRVYAVKGKDGQYRIFDEEISPELEDYLNQLSANEDVRLLISQVDRQAEEAAEADTQLKQRLAYLKNGPEYMQEESQEESSDEKVR